MLKNITLVTALIGVLATPVAYADAAAKKELIDKLLVLQQPAMDAAARSITEQQPMQMASAAQKLIVQSVPEDKRLATAKAVDAELKKYVDAVSPMIQASAKKLAQSTMGPTLDEKFTEEELRKIIGILESPELKKFQAVLPTMTEKLLEKIIEDARPNVDPLLNKTAANVRQILQNASSAKAAPAKPAPAKK